FEGIDSRSNTSISAIASRESDCLTLPWYWVSAKETISRVPDSKWLISFRDITNVSNERTAVFTFLPFSGVGHTAPLIFSRFPLNPLFLVASINSFIFDYSTRQKVGGTHLTYSYLKQLPVLGPDIFSRSISNVFLPKLFELIYTSWDLASFADELWNKSDMDLKKNILKQHEQNIRETNSTRIKLEEPSWIKYIRSSNSPSENYPRPPFVWDEIRRFRIRCELEALFGHLYNLTRNEVEYILETFPIFKRRDIERHGEFRTKQVILEEFEKLKDDPILEGVCVPLNKRVSSFENPYILQPVSPTPPVFDKPANKITPPIRKPKPKTAKPTKKFKVPENQTQLFGGDTDYSAERSDYGLYRCTKCGKSVMGFSIEEHTQEVHQGNDPGYQKIN
ncbi:MAG: hypothetical protein ISR58_19670, partial [Anaerolineales bacterium]|nr:hypothetical protein [Anaerolineales bacterium]